ncbi:hypothetical protein ACJ41O_007149 [Fusarium nematophilum]
MLCPPISTWLAKIKDRTRQRDIESHTGQHDSQPPVETTEDDELLFPSWPPLNPREMLSRQAFYKDRMKHRKYRAPMGIFTDSPLYALYRLYEWIMADHTPVSSIPDLGEQQDSERYAVLACILALLVESFNERNRLGLRRAEPHSILSVEEHLQWAATPMVLETEPSWTEGVPALKTLLHIPHSQPGCPYLTALDDPEASEAFKKKNIPIVKPHTHFV